MVAGLSVLEMYMLVAVLRLGRKGHAACNFEQAMEEYGLLNQMQRHADAHPRPLALRAFERLLAHGLLTPADFSARSASMAWHLQSTSVLKLESMHANSKSYIC